jgi:hypothetical protein
MEAISLAMALGLLYFEGEICRRMGRVQMAGSGDGFRRFDGQLKYARMLTQHFPHLRRICDR